MLSSKTSPFLLLWLGAAWLSQGKQCYYPDGTKVGDQPCNPTAEVSVCCGIGIGFACLENGLCKEPAGALVRGSCTTENQPADGCPNFCTGKDTVFKWNDVVSCNNVTHDDKSFCCEQNAGCCDSGVARFVLEPPRARTSALWDNRLARYTLVPEFASLSTAPTSSTTPASSKATTATTASSPTGSTQVDSQGSSATGGLDMGAKIGLGVGIGLGVILIACCGYIIYRLRARSNEHRAQSPAEVSASPYKESLSTYTSHQPALSYQSPVTSELHSSSYNPNAWSQHKSSRAELD